MNCNKYKKKAIYGVLLLSYFIIIRLVDLSIYVEVNILVIFAVILGILSMYLLLPYIKCLQDYSNKHKPPF